MGHHWAPALAESCKPESTQDNRSYIVADDGMVVKDIAIREGFDSIPGPVKSKTAANGSPHLRRFCVVEALLRGNGSRRS